MGNTKLFYFDGTLRPGSNLAHNELSEELRTGDYVVERLRIEEGETEARVMGAMHCSSTVDPTWALVRRMGPLLVVRADLDWTDVHVLEYDRDGALVMDRHYESAEDWHREELCCLCSGTQSAWGCRCSCHRKA
jgi:hypothetical protein